MLLPNLLKSTRQYFWNLNFDEVEIPYLNSSLPLEPNIYSFETIWRHTKAKFYLPTSPELALKKQLATTQHDCFSIAHCFRDLESEGPHHTKEFLMLEWYEVGKTYLDLMTSVENYLLQFNFKTPFLHYQLPQELPDNEPDFNQFFLNEVEPNLPTDPVFITGYPAFLSPLALPNERFELYINRVEVANGCTENRDPKSINIAFEIENTYRLQNNLPLHPFSTEFIDICSSLPPCAGVGLGIDRFKLLSQK
jgi:lysyl-tRNA synthetase class 2